MNVMNILVDSSCTGLGREAASIYAMCNVYTISIINCVCVLCTYLHVCSGPGVSGGGEFEEGGGEDDEGV